MDNFYVFGFLALWLPLMGFFIAMYWKLYTKMGLEGWISLIPFLNIIKLSEKIDMTWWWFFVPFLNVYAAIISCFKLARSFGKSDNFAIGILLLGPVFYAMLAFGSAEYIGPNGISVDGDDPFARKNIDKKEEF